MQDKSDYTCCHRCGSVASSGSYTACWFGCWGCSEKQLRWFTSAVHQGRLCILILRTAAFHSEIQILHIKSLLIMMHQIKNVFLKYPYFGRLPLYCWWFQTEEYILYWNSDCLNFHFGSLYRWIIEIISRHKSRVLNGHYEAFKTARELNDFIITKHIPQRHIRYPSDNTS